MTLPSDLNISGKPDPSNKDYYEITINPLKLNTNYAFQFQWIFEDKSIGEKVGDNWSNVFKVTTISDSINKPQFRQIDLDYTTNTLLVSWTGKDYLGADYKGNLQRVDIWAKGGSFGETYKVVGEFTKSGTKTITAAAGQYYVKLQAVSNSGGVSLFSDEQTIITESPIVVDNIPPANPTDFTATFGIDPNDQTGFSVYAKFSWAHHPNAATNGTRGYRIRWTYDTENPVYEYAFVNYPNNSYTATGLIPNIQYTYQVASVDQFNNTQDYYTGGTFTATDPTSGGGWARLKNYLSAGGATGDLFKFGTGITSRLNTSITTSPALTTETLYNGIILNKPGNMYNNYWLTTGQFRVGGNTQFMYWDGTNLAITGDLGVGGSATIAGNLFMKTTGASIYSGTLNAQGELPEGTAGYILNNSGLLVQNNETGANRKYVRLDPATGTIFANNAQITGQLVITSGSTKDAIDDAASKAQTATNNVTTLTGTVNTLSGNVSTLQSSLTGKLDSALYTKSEIIQKINNSGNGTQISGSVISTGAIISYNVSAGDNGIRGETFTQAGTILDLDDGTISTPNFRINDQGAAFFKGSITSGSSITGASITGSSITSSATDAVTGGVVTTSINGGLISISDTGNSFLSSGGISISGKNLANDNVSSSIGAAYFGLTDPSRSAIITMSGTGRLLIYTSGSPGNYGTVEIGGSNQLTNLAVGGTITATGGLGAISVSVGSAETSAAVRNIYAGTTSKSSSATDGLRGDVYIQYSA